VLQRLQTADVPASPIYSVADILEDQHYWAREMLLRVSDPRLGSVVVLAVMPKLADSPCRHAAWASDTHAAHRPLGLTDQDSSGRMKLHLLQKTEPELIADS
jgi:crotonobetainyl-CoA:carnitine CoA-transferase CaiB-like acyl-CoA transferase